MAADNNDAQSWYLLGRCYMSQQKYPKAYDAYQQAVYRDGRNPTFWCSIGVLYYQINQYRDALDAYSRAIRLNPYISEVWYDLGTLVSLSSPCLQARIMMKEKETDRYSSMNHATTKPTTPWMRISALQISTPQMCISKHAFNFFGVGNPRECQTRTAHQCHRMSILRRIRRPAWVLPPARSGALRLPAQARKGPDQLHTRQTGVAVWPRCKTRHLNRPIRTTSATVSGRRHRRRRDNRALVKSR